MQFIAQSRNKLLFSHFSLSWRLEFALVMSCKQWTRRLAYTYTALILTFATSLILMVYVHTSARGILRPKAITPDDSIPLVDFKDLGNSKPRLLLLVTAGSAAPRYDRRQAIRDTWWKHCKDSQVNISLCL